jgi:hypothetical protein
MFFSISVEKKASFSPPRRTHPRFGLLIDYGYMSGQTPTGKSRTRDHMDSRCWGVILATRGIAQLTMFPIRGPLPCSMLAIL